MNQNYESIQKEAFGVLVREGIYDENFTHSDEAKDFFRARLVAALSRVDKGEVSILDCGCGPGVWLAGAKDVAGSVGRSDIRLFGFDITAEMIQLARQRLADYVNPCQLQQGDLLRRDAYHFEGNDGRFDIIFAYDAIQQLPRKRQFRAIELMTQVLAKSGEIVIFDHDCRSGYGRMMGVRKFITQYFSIGLVPRYYCNAKYPPLVKFSERLNRSGRFHAEIFPSTTSPKRALVIRRID